MQNHKITESLELEGACMISLTMLKKVLLLLWENTEILLKYNLPALTVGFVTVT